MRLTVRDAVFEFLRRQGVDTVFGGASPPSGLPADFRWVPALHDAVAVGAAAGHAAGTGSVGVAFVRSAAGLPTHDRVPLLILAATATSSAFAPPPGPAAATSSASAPPPGPAAATSSASAPSPGPAAAASSASAPSPGPAAGASPGDASSPGWVSEVPAAVADAWWAAMTPPRRAAVVTVPDEAWDLPGTLVGDRVLRADFVAGPAALAEVAAALNAARQPALVIGAGVDQDDAQDLAVELAERIGAAVWLAPLSARAGFPEDHRLFQGVLPPQLDGHDVVLALGGAVTAQLPATQVFTLDCAPAPNGTSLLSTVRTGLDVLLDLVEKRYRAEPPPLARPARAGVLSALRAAVPVDAIVVADLPGRRAEFHDRFPISRPGGFLAGTSPGDGLPLAVGRALASPDERIVCLTEAASALRSIQALWTAVHINAAVTVVVLDSADVDLAQVAAGFGCPSSQAASPSALATALNTDGPYLLTLKANAKW